VDAAIILCASVTNATRLFGHLPVRISAFFETTNVNRCSVALVRKPLKHFQISAQGVLQVHPKENFVAIVGGVFFAASSSIGTTSSDRYQFSGYSTSQGCVVVRDFVWEVRTHLNFGDYSSDIHRVTLT